MLGNAIAKAIGQLMWSIVEGIFNIIANLGECFMYLSGISPREENGSILSGLYNDDIKNVYIFMCFIAVVVLVLSILIGIAKAQYNKDSYGSTKQVFSYSLKAVLFLVLFPIICYIFIYFVGVLLGFTINGTQYYLHQNSSAGMGTQIAEGVFNASLPSSFVVEEGVSISWTDGYETLLSKNVPLKMNGYNYVLSILVSAMILWALLMTTTQLVERIINLIVYYFLAPIMISTSPLDQGSRFNNLKDSILSQYLKVAGNILSMTIYLYLASWINQENHITGLSSSATLMVKCIVLISGAFMCCKGSTLIAHLISQNVGQQEGFSQQQTGAMLHGGMALGGAMLRGARYRANQLASAGAGGVSGALGSGSSGSLLGGGDNNNGVQLAPKTSLLKGIGSKVSSGASKVRNGGLLAVAGLVGAAFNPMRYVRAFRKDDSKFLESVGSKKNLSAHDNKRLEKMANKEAMQQQRQANLDSGKNKLQDRANILKATNKFASTNSPMMK